MMAGEGEFGGVSLPSLVAMVGWLILVVSGYRSYRVSGRTTLTYVLIWASAFGLAALVFGAMA